LLQDLADSRRGVHLECSSLPEQYQSQRMIQLRVSGHDSFQRNVTDAGRHRPRQADDLVPDVWRGVEQKPAFTICADGGGRLAAREGSLRVRASDPAHGAPAVPLREPPTSSGTEKNDSQAGTAEGLAFASPPCQCWLERGNVRGNFHGHGHNFSFGLGPRHNVLLRKSI
jgi:hypothetical protein